MFSQLSEWWGGLGGFELILWVIALVFTLLFIIQTIFSFIGGGDADDMDGFGDEGHHLFTIKNFIAFFTMFGWAGLASLKSGAATTMVVLIALAAGIAMVAIMYLLMRQTYKLKHSGTLQIRNALNVVGETYLRIPASRAGIGKVVVQVQGRLMELDAMTDDPEEIHTGKPIRVVDTISNQILLVTSRLQYQS